MTSGVARLLQGQPAVLVANPSAQSGKAADWIRRARALLDGAQVPHRFVATTPDGGTSDQVFEVIEGGTRVVIYMGGDGTFAEVAKGILRSPHARDVAMGMLPIGTANDQGKSFGLETGPGGLDRNIAVIAAGQTIGCDVGKIVIERGLKEIHRDLFFDSFSVGLGAASLATRNRDKERASRIPGLGALYRDQLVYLGAVVQRFAESYVVDIKFDLDVVIDGTVYNFPGLIDVIVKNTHVFGGEWIFNPQSESDDGRFEVIPVTGRRDLTAKLIASLRHSPIGHAELEMLGIRSAAPIAGTRMELTVRTEGGTLPPAQIDGEEITAGERYVIEVATRALRLIVPREHVEPAHLDSPGSAGVRPSPGISKGHSTPEKGVRS